MPHSTLDPSMRVLPLNGSANTKSYADSNDDTARGAAERFPEFEGGLSPVNGQSAASRWQNGYTDGSTNASSRWHARRDSRVKWGPGDSQRGAFGHGRQRSISNAIQRLRSGSMSQNAHDIADALRAPVSYKLIALCIMWYWSSALTNTSSKSILTAFDKPATLTLVQFAFVSSYCLLFSWLASTFPQIRTAIPALKYSLRYPSRDVIATTLPLAAFQIFGHLLSSNATSKIPVSLVHTIKGLSPLFTVLAYRLIFDIQYPKATYLSLIPLTVGVMLACSGKHAFGGQFLGILYTLLATVIFVTQNIFSKRLFNEAAKAEEQGLGAQSRKLDKLNLLCYSSGLAFLLTGPIWLWSEGIGIIADFLWDGSVDLSQSPNSFDHGRLTLEFIFNGTFHFGQNILAFVLLSMVSPVTYSVASLIKRVFVIIIAIIWFRSPTTNIQAVGICLTFLGLYLYDRSNIKNKADQRARSLSRSNATDAILPLNMKQETLSSTGPVFESPVSNEGKPPLYSYAYTNGHAAAAAAMSSYDNKKSDDITGHGRAGASTAGPGWLAPGTKQEDTWRRGDQQNLVTAR